MIKHANDATTSLCERGSKKNCFAREEEGGIKEGRKEGRRRGINKRGAAVLSWVLQNYPHIPLPFFHNII